MILGENKTVEFAVSLGAVVVKENARLFRFVDILDAVVTHVDPRRHHVPYFAGIPLRQQSMVHINIPAISSNKIVQLIFI